MTARTPLAAADLVRNSMRALPGGHSRVLAQPRAAITLPTRSTGSACASAARSAARA